MNTTAQNAEHVVVLNGLGPFCVETDQMQQIFRKKCKGKTTR